MTHVPPPSPHSPPLRHPVALRAEDAELPPPPAPGVVVRVTQPDLQRRQQLERSRGRLVLTALGFGALFIAVAMKATWSTVIAPAEPKRLNAAVRAMQPPSEPVATRAAITDRNGEILAINLPVNALVANPRVIQNPVEVADKLRTVLPQLDREKLIERLSSDRGFAYIVRALTPREQQGIINLGIAGLDFEESERRYHPQGRAAVHVLGNVDVDGNGISGVERFFDSRLREDPTKPVKLSLDVRVQLALRDAVSQAISDFNGIGGAGIVLDINSAEVLGMVSLPDYDASDITDASPDQRFNRATVGLYEPGSTFKLLTAAAALEYGTAHVNSSMFDASKPIRYGRFTISDYKGKNRWITFPEVLAYSSNLGAAHMAETFGPQRQREFLKSAGMLARKKIELPETAAPMAPPANHWRDINMFTIAFGHGISVTPLHVISGISALANGGILREPTLLAQPAGAARPGTRIISEQTSTTIRKLMRLVVTDGSGKNADVPGYFVGGKTGTAQKTGPHGGYLMNKRIGAFVGAFPIQAPRYAVYVMIDEPSPNAKSHGYATAGWVAAPAAYTVISRIAPVLGLVPEDPNDPAIIAATSIPLQPSRPTRPSQATAASTPPASRPAAPTPPRAAAQQVLRPPQPVAPPAVRAVPMPNLPARPGSLPPPVPLRMTMAEPQGSEPSTQPGNRLAP
ncbi:penicillin-binding transpeptidase domain-containing protein [Roseomonas sp. E05]|uniref:peptidoglycan D,D-transpeptidase FtsI family protein n=1 Tax=Roseomonas sp. E05 TaxID=3046310 RepID=UPI0024BA3F28|nr:penicillin-binding transpeptidase domain-containing protein [Roseomonas sp. E05]MDJ0387410.1 penicillin-binding transpeptidase domain-containing protein [Roseomonas sp. E05]